MNTSWREKGGAAWSSLPKSKMDTLTLSSESSHLPILSVFFLLFSCEANHQALGQDYA